MNVLHLVQLENVLELPLDVRTSALWRLFPPLLGFQYFTRLKLRINLFLSEAVRLQRIPPRFSSNRVSYHASRSASCGVSDNLRDLERTCGGRKAANHGGNAKHRSES